MSKHEAKQEWGTRVGVILAVAGSAVAGSAGAGVSGVRVASSCAIAGEAKATHTAIPVARSVVVQVFTRPPRVRRDHTSNVALNSPPDGSPEARADRSVARQSPVFTSGRPAPRPPERGTGGRTPSGTDSE